MITGELKNKIDAIWNTFWTGGIANPMVVVEQLTYLLFIKGLDEEYNRQLSRANRLGRPVENPVFAPEDERLRWSAWKSLDPEGMFRIVRDEVFPHMKEIGGAEGSYAQNMRDAVFAIPKPSILVKVVGQLDALEMTNTDIKGDVYEYILSHLSSAGKNGQFRTPRHIIDMMVRLVAPGPKDKILDPASGTSGFLVAAAGYVKEAHPESQSDAALHKHYQTGMFTGYDFDATMTRIGSMNLMMHGITGATIERRDTLIEDSSFIEDMYDVVLANPPFKGSIDYESTAKNLLAVAKTKKTELLFVAQILRALKAGGRAAVIVPDGVLFGNSGAHKAIRKALVEDHKLEAMISMPSGVFKPYAGVSTGILVFTKTGAGGTDRVWMYDMQADGLSLDDKRQKVDENDIPDILARWAELDAEEARERTEKSFFASREEIAEADYDLSINRYKEIPLSDVEHRDPKEVIAELKTLEKEIATALEELEGMI